VAPLTGRGAGARVSSRTRRAATGPLVRHPRATPCTGAARLQAGEHGNPEPRTLPVAPRGRVLGEFAPALQSRVPLFKKETGGLKKKSSPTPRSIPPPSGRTFLRRIERFDFGEGELLWGRWRRLFWWRRTEFSPSGSRFPRPSGRAPPPPRPPAPRGRRGRLAPGSPAHYRWCFSGCKC